MMIRSFFAMTLASCALLLGCVGAPEDDEPEVAVEEQVGTAEEAVTWYCEGWTPSLYQYCLTRCQFNSALQPVGTEDNIDYGQCNSKAEQYCQSHGWGAHYSPCWGWYY